MQHRTSSSTVRNWKVVVSLLVSYLVLIAPLAPVAAAAATRTRSQTNTSSRSSERQQQQQTPLQAQPAQTLASQPVPTPNAPSVVNIAATKNDTFTDADGDGKAEIGQVITYTVQITNSGDTDATGVQFSDTVDPKTTFVADSAHASPLARNESYTTVANTLLEVSNSPTSTAPKVTAAGTVFDNDSIPTSPDTIQLQTFQATSAQGGTVSVNADGSFTYLPAAGFTGTDTFTYTIRNSAVNTLQDTATVTVTVNGPRVWYVDNSGANGTGRSTSPFNTLAGAAAVDAANDIIYVFTGSGNYTGGITLENNEQLIGNGVALVVNTITLRAAGTRPTIINGSGNGITLGSGNTVTGLNFGNASGFALQGTNVGTLAVNTVAINTTGGGLDLTGVGTPTVNVVLDSLTSSGGTRNVNLVGLNGTVTLGSGALSGATTAAVDVSGAGNAVITYTGTVGSTTGRSVNVSGKNGGSVSFSGAVSGSGTGISLTNDSGTTINFTGGISLTTGANAAFTATGGGTVNATQNNSTILNVVSTTTGTGVNIATPTNIGGSGVTFRSVTVNNGASNSATNGIILNGTTGTFLVSGDGTQTGGFFNRNGSGGTLNRTTGHSVLLTNATNVTLRQMNITNTAAGGSCPNACTADGVHSTTGGSIVLSAVTLQNLGGNGWRADNITGTNAINNNSLISTWNTATTNGVSVANTTTNFSGTFTVDRCLFTTSATGADGFLFDVDVSAGGGTVAVTNSEFTLIDQDAIQINHDGTGTLTANVQSNNIHDADATGGDGNNTVILAVGGGGQLNFSISNNTLTNLARLSANQGVLQVQAAGGAAGSSTGARLNGSIQNNTLTNPGFVSQRRGIMAATEASAGNHGGHSILISGNSVQGFFLHGIYTSFASINGSDNLNNNLTISNNQVGNLAAVGQGGGDAGSAIELESLIAADNSGGDIAVNALIQGNTAVSNNSSGIGDTLDIANASGVTTGAGNSSTMNLKVVGNNLTQQNASGQVFEARNVLSNTTTICLDLNADNTTPNTATGGNGTGFRLTNDAGTYRIEGLGAQTPSAHLSPKNNGGTVTASGTFITSAGCADSTARPEPFDIPALDETASGALAQQNAQNNAAQDSSITSGRPFISLPRQTQQPTQSAATTNRTQPSTTRKSAPNALNAPNASLPVSVGTLNPGKTVTIQFQVTVNSPFPTTGPASVSNQGSVSGSNFSTVLTDDPGTGTANDPTVTPVDAVRLTIGDVSVAEGATGLRTVTLTVNLSQTTNAGAFTVHYQTNNNTATAPADYVAVPDTVLNVPGTALTATITLPPTIKGDTIFEGNRNFFVDLSNSSGNAAILDSQAVVTIADDEPQVADLSGDGLTDASIWNSNNGNWFVINSGTSTTTMAANDWGRAALGDIAVPGDYDFDNRIDIAVFRPSEGNWYILKSNNGTPIGSVQNWGQNGDIPVPGDYDGDGKTDLAVFRPTQGNWYILKSAGGNTVQNWGISTDKPVVGDFDGDGKSDLAVFRVGEGNWYILNSGGGITIQNWGVSTDKLVPGDYDGDGKTDMAIYRNGTWFIRNSNGGTTIKTWGEASDLAIPGDYDGDGKFDISVWRPGEGKFYTIRSSDNTVLLQTIELGGAGIKPVPNTYLPQ